MEINRETTPRKLMGHAVAREAAIQVRDYLRTLGFKDAETDMNDAASVVTKAHGKITIRATTAPRRVGGRSTNGRHAYHFLTDSDITTKYIILWCLDTRSGWMFTLDQIAELSSSYLVEDRWYRLIIYTDLMTKPNAKGAYLINDSKLEKYEF